MPNKNPYIWSGLGLLLAGGLISVVSYFVLMLTWLTALGISMLILSFILLALGRTIPKLPPGFSSLFLETGIDNVAALVEELGLNTKAVYLPSSLTSGRPQALLPLHSNQLPSTLTKRLPQRFIVNYGTGPDDIGLLMSTTGTAAVQMLELPLGRTSEELESALTSLLAGVLGAASGAKVSLSEGHIIVDIHNPYLESENTCLHQCLGGPLAAIVASVSAEALDRPVTIKQEEHLKSKLSVELEVLP